MHNMIIIIDHDKPPANIITTITKLSPINNNIPKYDRRPGDRRIFCLSFVVDSADTDDCLGDNQPVEQHGSSYYYIVWSTHFRNNQL